MIKLTPVKHKTNPRNKYEIELSLMHGDADKYEKAVIPCKNEAEFLRRMEALKNMPLSTAAGGNKYEKWCEDTFSDYIPRDCIYGQCRDCSATIDMFEGFYWDEHGTKYHAGVVES